MRRDRKSRALVHARRAYIAAFVLLYLSILSYGVSQYFRGREGDFKHFFWAAEAVVEGRDIYASGEGGYLYPPLFAAALSPLARISFVAAAGTWAVVNVLCLAAGALLFAHEALRRLGGPVGLVRGDTVGLALLGSAVLFDKVRGIVSMGQTDGLVLFCAALALRALGTRREAGAKNRASLGAIVCGGALGLAMNVKYLVIVFLPYLILRRRWREASAMVVMTAAFALLGAVAVGWERNLGYLGDALAALGEVVGVTSSHDSNPHPLTWERSVSVTSALGKFMEERGMARYALPLSGLVALGVAGSAWWIYRSRGASLFVGRGGARDDDNTNAGSGPALVLMEWAGVLVGTLAFSPQTTSRHAILAMPMVMAGLVITIGSARRPTPGAGFGEIGDLLDRGRRPDASARVAAGAGVALLALALHLPPTGDGFEAAVAWWRDVGGIGWCLCAGYLLVLWAVLGGVRELPMRVPGKTA